MRLGLGDVRLRRYSDREAAFGQVERLLIVGDGLVKQLLRGIESAQVEVIDREFGVHAKPHALQIGGACLRTSPRGVILVRDFAPQIGLPTRIERDGIVVVRLAGGLLMTEQVL